MVPGEASKVSGWVGGRGGVAVCAVVHKVGSPHSARGHECALGLVDKPRNVPVTHRQLNGSAGAGGVGVRAGKRKGAQTFWQVKDCAIPRVHPPLRACVRMGSSRAAAAMSASVGSPTSPSSDANRWPVRGRAAAAKAGETVGVGPVGIAGRRSSEQACACRSGREEDKRGRHVCPTVSRRVHGAVLHLPTCLGRVGVS